ncbi:MAG: TIGR03016 family PEP-CTERM system-associated outer membrane protein [Gammaproteobacteria bacterium]|nr:TIGR03016 family PEP-CTERM system-associated outer membrane protein [Gammaproteobacteria bacterium]
MILKSTSSKLPLLVFSCFLLNFTSLSFAASWKIQPSVEARLGYSDNIEFDDSGDEDSGFIGQINPGVSIQKDEGRLLVQLDYLMQNFYYLDDSDLSTDHTLDAISRYEFVPKTFFLNGYATVTQVLVDSTEQISVDNLNSTGNTTDEITLGIEPVWEQNLGTYMKARAAYLYAVQNFEDETDEDQVGGDIDDNDRHRFLANLGNRDVDSDRFDWGLGYRNEEVEFEDGEEFKFVSQQVDVGYDLTSRIEIVGTYGYEDNDFGNIVITDEDEDDVFWDAGFIYSLGEFTALEVRRGERFFGNTWESRLNVGGPKLSASINYEEDTSLEVLDSIDSDGFSSQENLLQNDVDTNIANDRDSVSITKSWDATITYTVSKSTIAANVTNDDLEFLDSGDREKSESYALGWLWDISGVSSLLTTVEWIEDEFSDLGVEEKSSLFDFRVVYTRKLSAKTDFDIDYSYSDGNEDDIDGDDDFTSNTISVGLVHNF